MESPENKQGFFYLLPEWQHYVTDLFRQVQELQKHNENLLVKLYLEEDRVENLLKLTKQNQGNNKRPRKRKALHELNRANQCRRRKSMRQSFVKLVEDLPDVKKARTEVTLNDDSTLIFHSNDADREEEKERTEEEMQKKLARTLLIKDRYRISDEALHELHMVAPGIPSKNKIQAERKRLSSCIQIIEDLRPDSDAAYRRLQDILDFLLQSQKYQHLMDTEEDMVHITMRYAADGARISKRQNSVRGVVKIITPRDQIDPSNSPDDEHTLFLYLGEETKAELEKHATATFQDMRTAATEGFEINEKRVIVDWILCSDWKNLAITRGINAANSTHFCLWCHCKKEDIRHFEDETKWDIVRSSADRQHYQGKTGTARLGYVSDDLLDFIEHEKMVPDELHLRMRISNKLFNQVVTWAIDQGNEKELLAELKRIKVPFQLTREQGDDQRGSILKWSQPNGDDLNTIMKHFEVVRVLEPQADKRLTKVESLSVAQLKEELQARQLSTKGKKADLVQRLKSAIGIHTQLPKKRTSRLRIEDHDDAGNGEENRLLDPLAIENLWKEFDSLMESLRALPGTDAYKTPEEFHCTAKQWGKNFRHTTFDEDVIPYIHCLVYHVHQFLGQYKYLVDIGVSQVERKNFDQREAYFGATNRYGGKYRRKVSVQILERENRILYAKDQGMERQKRRYCRRHRTDE